MGLDCLNSVHDCGYVHRDLKSENVLLVSATSESFVAMIRDSERKKMGLDYLRGAAFYMALETIIENVQDPKSDIWAFWVCGV